MPASKSALPADAELEQQIQKVLAFEPKRQDLRLRLLRVFFAANRVSDFLREAATFREYGGARPESPDWHTVCQMGRIMAPDHVWFRDAADLRLVEWTPQADVVVNRPPYRRFAEDDDAKRALNALSDQCAAVLADPRFLAEVEVELAGKARPTPLYHARRLSNELGGAQIYLKREDLAPPASRLTIQVVGLGVLARRLGRTCLVTGTTDGQKGALVASIAARLGLKAQIFMLQEHHERQAANVLRMELMGAAVQAVDERHLRRKDIREASLDHWLRHESECLLVVGLDSGPEPYPRISTGLASVIGREVRRQLQAQARRPPDLLVARGGESADAIGFFGPFITERDVRMICVEPASEPASSTANAANPHTQLSTRQLGVVRSILEGVEYPSVVREHADLRRTGRVEYVSGRRQAGLEMIGKLGQLEGILPALETAEALAWACEAAQLMKSDAAVVVMNSEKIEKDIWEIARLKSRPI